MPAGFVSPRSRGMRLPGAGVPNTGRTASRLLRPGCRVAAGLAVMITLAVVTGAQGSSSTGSPTATRPGSMVEP